MCPLSHDRLSNSRQSVEDDGASSAFDVVYRSLGETNGERAGDSPAEEGGCEGHGGGGTV